MVDTDDDPDWVEGVDFSSINPVLEEVSYPITTDEIIERYGDREVDRTNADPITLEELFGYMGDETFEDDDGVRQMILAQMPRGSQGRDNYSDRGGSLPTETEEAEEAADQTSADVEEGTSTDTETKQQ